MTVDAEPFIDPLAYVLCEAEGRCSCRMDGVPPCDGEQDRARAAIAYLLPLIVERCAEEAEKRKHEHASRVAFYEKQTLRNAANASRTRVHEAGENASAIRALIPAKGGDHE